MLQYEQETLRDCGHAAEKDHRMKISGTEKISNKYKQTKVKCWEVFRCNEDICPAFLSHNVSCWLFTGTHCRNEIQGKFMDKIDLCMDCTVFERNMDTDAMLETCRVFNRQLKEYRNIVEERDRELENMRLELAMTLSEVFEALKKISSGDPTVRIPEVSDIELIVKLKHMINSTAENIGEIVDQSHEIAICIAEHFDVFHRVSKGDLSARVTGGSEIELLESLKNVTNETIESISREMTERKSAEDALRGLEALKSSILSAIPHAVVGLYERRIFFANQAVEAVFGWKPEDLIGRSARILFRNDEEYEEIGRRCYPILEKRKRYAAEFPYRHRNGNDILCTMNASVIGKELKDNGIVAVYEDITERKRAESELKSSREQLRYLSAHLQSAIEEERMEIARDFHDELGQLLTALKMDLFWLTSRIQKSRNRNKEKFLMKIGSMAELIDLAVKTVQQKSAELRPGLLDDLGLTAAIEWQASEFWERTGITCNLKMDFADDSILDRDIATAIYRIFQEALTNIARHSNAAEMEVILRQEAEDVLLEVSDNGRGITCAQITDAKSYGLTGIRERVHLLGGQVSIEGSSGKGTTLKVSIPLKTQIRQR